MKDSYLGRLLDTEEPHGASNAGADEELDKGARDRERVRLEHLLVPDVEEDVGGVPEREKEAQVERAAERRVTGTGVT